MKYFFRFLSDEVYKILHTRQFLFTISIISALVIVDGIYAYKDYLMSCDYILVNSSVRADGTFSINPSFQTATLYNSWIGGRRDIMIPLIFFFTLPIFVVIPYSWTYLSEEESGYMRTMVTRLGKARFYICKYISAFISGCITAFIPMLVSFTFTACFIPAYKPDVTYDLYYQVRSSNLLGNIYYQHPLITVILSMMIICTFSGIWATIPYVISMFVKNKFIDMFSPYLVLLFIISSSEKALAYRSSLEPSIMNYIRLTSSYRIQNAWVFAGEMLALFLIPFTIMLIKGECSDVY